MRSNKKSNSLQKISLNKTKKNNGNKKTEDASLKNKEKNISLGKINTKEERISSLNRIFNVIKSNDIKKIEEIIKNDRTLLNKLNNNGLSLLHILVIKKNIKIIELLLKNVADINIK